MHLPRRLGRAALALVVSAFAAPALACPSSRSDVSRYARSRAKLEFEGVSKAIDIDELRAQHLHRGDDAAGASCWSPFCTFSNYRGFEERHYLDRQELTARRPAHPRALLPARATATRRSTPRSRAEREGGGGPLRHPEGPPTIVDGRQRRRTTRRSSRRRRCAASRCSKAGEPLDLFEHGLDARQLPERALGAGLRRRTGRHVVRRRPTRRARRGCSSGSCRTTSRRSATSSSPGPTRSRRARCSTRSSFRQGDLFRRSTVLESQRNLYESNLFKLAAIEVPQSFDSVEDGERRSLREAQLHEARISVGFNTVDYSPDRRTLHATTTCSAARGGSTCRRTVGNLVRESLNGTGHLPPQPADTTHHGRTRPTSSSRRGRRASSSRSRRSSSAAKNSLSIGGVRAAARRAGGGDRPWLRRQRHLHAHARHSRAGEPERIASK